MFHPHGVTSPSAPIAWAGSRFRAWNGLRRWPDLQGSLGRIGSLEVRLAASKKDVRRAQRVRYRSFYEEGGAIPDRTTALTRRDRCAFDRIADHLLVVDHAALNKFGVARPKVVGTYRLLRQDVAQRHGGFYSSREFDIGPLLARHPGSQFLELGRSCVLPVYRTKRTIELLWRGIWAYVQHYHVDALIGCASLEGTDVKALATQLSFLHHHASAPPEWHARALPSRYVAMGMQAKESVDPRRALASLPPLVKGYLRCGATFGEGAVVDHQFGTTDVFVVMPIAQIASRYSSFFGGETDAPAQQRDAA
ncbi:GNAT family N-acetyltransferase [Lichenihabitans psoromatis]|uniref:GNAT family N-acetyltransferase n=1 Tax=Lichenihabitans psoromatis TaxID=2528642 RepID=UPI001036094E|nr:GNAT family N-acyltransferase [Lichenihabitans psoromatis]